MKRVHASWYAPDLIRPDDAERLWHQSIHLIRSGANSIRASEVRLGNGKAALLHYLIDASGHLQRLWVRTVCGNELVIVGNRDGLLPLKVEPLHAK